MSGTISFNPYSTNQPQNSFLLQTQGYVQGAAYDDPSARLWLAEGFLAASEAVPMWGGRAISELVNIAGSGADGLGAAISSATATAGSASGVTGFSVFNQMAHMVITPGNTVPLAGVGNGVGFFRLGTNARIAVAIDPALVTTLQGANAPINDVSLTWDKVNYRISATTGANFFALTGVRLLSINTNSKIVSWSSPNATWTAGSAAIILI